MKRSFINGLIVAAALAFSAAPALAERTAEHPHAPAEGFSWQGPMGTFQVGQLQRGYKVYKEVCSACHSMKLLSFRNLGEPGGPFWNPEYPNANENPVVKAIAGEFEVPDVDSETGDVIRRKATPADRFPSPYANEEAAKASNGGAAPPDLSVIAKARHGGGMYVYSILTGYRAAPAGLTMGPGMHYNPWMPGELNGSWKGHGEVPIGGVIAMPPPLSPDRVSFDDKRPSTVANQAADVATFLEWASDPHAVERKQAGLAVLIYLALLAGLTYLSYRAIWRNVSH